MAGKERKKGWMNVRRWGQEGREGPGVDQHRILGSHYEVFHQRVVRPDVNFRNPTVQCDRCINEKGLKQENWEGGQMQKYQLGMLGTWCGEKQKFRRYLRDKFLDMRWERGWVRTLFWLLFCKKSWSFIHRDHVSHISIYMKCSEHRL